MKATNKGGLTHFTEQEAIISNHVAARPKGSYMNPT